MWQQMAIAVGPNNLAFDYKNGKSDRERDRERVCCHALSLPLRPFSTLAAARATATKTMTTTLRNATRRTLHMT